MHSHRGGERQRRIAGRKIVTVELNEATANAGGYVLRNQRPMPGSSLPIPAS
jgi:hypothetical protein